MVNADREDGCLVAALDEWEPPWCGRWFSKGCSFLIQPSPEEAASLFKNCITEEADGCTTNIWRRQHLPAKPGRGCGAVTERSDFIHFLHLLETNLKSWWHHRLVKRKILSASGLFMAMVQPSQANAARPECCEPSSTCWVSWQMAGSGFLDSRLVFRVPLACVPVTKMGAGVS